MGGSFEDLTKAWAAMNATALPGWSTGRMAPTGDMSIDEWNHINEAIANLGGNVEANLQGWWNMNGALIEAKKSMAEYTKATEAAELVVEGLQAQETKLNASLTAHKERLSTLSSMKIKGEGAASDKSFRQGQALNRLELERLKIQQKARAGKATTADYNRLFVIAQQQKELELQKEIDDKATDLKYADKKRQLEKLLDPLKGQEKSYAALVKAIKQEQRVIAVKEKQLKSVQKTLEKERAKVAELKKAYDKISRSVDVFATKINEMAANFRSRYDEMIAKAKELADAIEEAKKKEAGGSMGSTMASPNLAGAGTRMSATNNTTNSKSTSVSYFYFDKLVLNDVQDVPSLTQELRMAKLRIQVCQ
jgi:chromosome segregation ATPase